MEQPFHVATRAKKRVLVSSTSGRVMRKSVGEFVWCWMLGKTICTAPRDWASETSMQCSPSHRRRHQFLILEEGFLVRGDPFNRTRAEGSALGVFGSDRMNKRSSDSSAMKRFPPARRLGCALGRALVPLPHDHSHPASSVLFACVGRLQFPSTNICSENDF